MDGDTVYFETGLAQSAIQAKYNLTIHSDGGCRYLGNCSTGWIIRANIEFGTNLKLYWETMILTKIIHNSNNLKT